MPEPQSSEQGNNPEAATQSSEPSQPGEPQAGATAQQTTTLPPAPERYGAEWGGVVAGRTAAEVAQMANQMAQALTQQQQQAQAAAAAPKRPESSLAITDPDQYQRDLIAYNQAVTQATIAQAAAPIVQQNAATVREIAAMKDGNKEAFKKWGQEIDNYVASIPLHERTPALYDRAVQLVRSNHIEELATERAQALMAANPGTASPSGGDNFTVESINDGDDDVWKKIASTEIGRRQIKALGKARIREFANEHDGGLEAYAEKIAKNNSVFDPHKPGEWTHDIFNEQGRSRNG